MTSLSASTTSTPPAGAFPQLRRAALVAVVANLGIVFTGGIVRVSQSGLGCPDWPACRGSSVVPAAQEAEWHTYVEFGNRLLTFAVLATAIWVVLAARREASSRRDILRLARLQPAGVVFQAVLGGVTVLTGLHPLVVAAHFLASMALVAAAVVLHDRAVQAPVDQARGLPGVTAAVVVVAGAVLVLGTLVTGAGPHAGDPGTVRLALDIRTIAVAHADAVWALVGLTVAAAVVARATGADRALRAALVLLGVELAQGGLGYLQYVMGVPPLPVAVHILGAGIVWATAWRLALAVHPARRPGRPDEPITPPSAVTVASTSR